MSQRVGTTVIVEKTEPANCELCGRLEELRPYGPNGESICVECAFNDLEGTCCRVRVAMEAMLKGATHVVGPQGQVIKVAGRVPGNA
jgi:hypothetical protein